MLTDPAQRFYDVPTDDPLLQGLDVNFKITEALKEKMDSTWCGGSGYILRRAAIEDIGGFPTDSVGEDMYCSNVLLGRGWGAIYIDETLQSGRVPESYKAHVKQQGRWVSTFLIQRNLSLHIAARGTAADSDRNAFLSIRKQCAANGRSPARSRAHLCDSLTLQHPHHHRHDYIACFTLDRQGTRSLRQAIRTP